MKQSRSIRQQMVQVIMAVTTSVVILVSLLFALISITVIQTMQKQAALASLGFAGEYCVTPLLFQDPDGANQVLLNFRSDPSVQSITLYDEKGNLFAQYQKDSTPITPPTISQYPYAEYSNSMLHLAIEVVSNNQRIGTLYAKVDNKNLYKTIIYVITAMLGTIPLILISAYLFAQKGQKRISKPILNLVDVVEHISYGKETPDIRSDMPMSHEVGQLFNEFGNMIHRISEGERELSRASEFLQTIVDSIPSMLIVVDKDDRVAMCNSKALQECDLSSPDQQPLWEAFPILERFRSEIADIRDSESVYERRAIPVTTGLMESCDIALYPLRDEEKHGVVIIITDVTELAKKDQQLIQIQKMETVGTLAGGLAHDFNNIIAGIVGTLSLMDYSEDDEIDTKELREYIDIMNHAGDRAKEMIDQLLSLSHKTEASFEPVDLKAVIKNVMAICDHSIDKSVFISEHYLDKNTAIYGNSSQLEQVVLNLCINAAHAMTLMRENGESQGGEITITVQKKVINENEYSSITMIPGGEYVILSIKDQGIGIPQDMLKVIFDPFFTTKGKGEGTGLGLSMVYNIINQHNGYLHIESEKSIGTEISLFFAPYKSDQPSQKKIEKESGKARSFDKTILIVDDEPQIRTIASKMLERLGFKTIVAEDGVEGIDIYIDNKESIDLIILDMVMPGLSGKEVFRKLLEIDPSVQVILSSGFSQDSRVLEVLNSGVIDFLHKPYRIDELRDCIYKALGITE